MAASMGPRPRGRGIGLTAVGFQALSVGFNGATTSRSWNPATADRPPEGPSASMGPRPRGRGISRTGRSRVAYSRFNGATTSRSWNLPGPRGQGARLTDASMGPRPRGRGIGDPFAAEEESHGQASMGPRPRGRGIQGPPARGPLARSGFNGATTSRSWNPGLNLLASPDQMLLQWGHDLAVVESAVLLPGVFPVATLQWGHDLAVVESLQVSAHTATQVLASMGPRPRGRGIRYHAPFLPTCCRLQWGHDLAVVESPPGER